VSYSIHGNNHDNDIIDDCMIYELGYNDLRSDGPWLLASSCLCDHVDDINGRLDARRRGL
jgi:hypothetical protein